MIARIATACPAGIDDEAIFVRDIDQPVEGPPIGRQRGERGPVSNQFKSQKEALSAHIADQIMTVHQFFQLSLELAANPRGISAKALLFDFLKNSHPAAQASGLPA